MHLLEARIAKLLRISTIKQPDETVLRIEGKLITPWSKELESIWHTLANELSAKRLLLDIRETTTIDQGGFELLAKIAQMANPKVLADTPLTRQFADRIQQLRQERKRQ